MPFGPSAKLRWIFPVLFGLAFLAFSDADAPLLGSFASPATAQDHHDGGGNHAAGGGHRGRGPHGPGAGNGRGRGKADRGAPSHGHTVEDRVFHRPGGTDDDHDRSDHDDSDKHDGGHDDGDDEDKDHDDKDHDDHEKA